MLAMKIPAWSYTSLKDFETCPRRYHEVRVLKAFADVQGEEAKWGDAVHKKIADRLMNGATLPMYIGNVESIVQRITDAPGELLVEYKMAMTRSWDETGWWDTDAWCRGIVDVAKVGRTNAVVLDWKTGKRKPDTTQLKLFSAMIMAKYPWVSTVRSAFVWLKHSALDDSALTRDELPQVQAEFVERAERLEAAFSTDNWPPRRSGLCKAHCPVLSCEHNGR